ncbi:hypothetical protein EDD36DRAFT_200172 [Exophiala viscosa]|uniref:Uncharacterized protein n=1 Tax=Exophiala viscosa TaxID=2486360 RepID=A0AAN6DXU3_9EURO|nr:hypothetical protein EDD36DRAFT_200172 [Exophiala viscosa]
MRTTEPDPAISSTLHYFQLGAARALSLCPETFIAASHHALMLVTVVSLLLSTVQSPCLCSISTSFLPVYSSSGILLILFAFLPSLLSLCFLLQPLLCLSNLILLHISSILSTLEV